MFNCWRGPAEKLSTKIVKGLETDRKNLKISKITFEQFVKFLKLFPSEYFQAEALRFTIIVFFLVKLYKLIKR